MSEIPAVGIAVDDVSGDAANQLDPYGIDTEEFAMDQLIAKHLLAQRKETPVVPPFQGNQQNAPAAEVLTLAEVLMGLSSEPVFVLDNQDAAVDPIDDASLIQQQLQEAEAVALAQKQKKQAMIAELEAQLAKKLEFLETVEKAIATSREMIDAMKAQVPLDHIRNARFDKELLKKDQEIERLRKAIDEKDEEAKKRQSKNASPNPTKKQLRTLITLGQQCLQNGLLDEKEAKTLEKWKLKRQREAAPAPQPKKPKGKRGRKKRAGLVMEAQNQPSLDVQESVQKDDREEKQQQVDNAIPEASEDQVEFKSLDDVTAAVEEEEAPNKSRQGMEQSQMADAVLKASPVISEMNGELGEIHSTKEMDNHELEEPADENLADESKGRFVDEPKRGDDGNEEVISRRVLRYSTKASAADTNDSGRKSQQLESAKTRQLNVKKPSKKPPVPGNVDDEQIKENSDTEAGSVDQSVMVLRKRGQKVNESNRRGAPFEGERKSKNVEVKSTDADEKTCSVKPPAKRLKIEDVVENMKAQKTDESQSNCGRMTSAMSQKKPGPRKVGRPRKAEKTGKVGRPRKDGAPRKFGPPRKVGRPRKAEKTGKVGRPRKYW